MILHEASFVGLVRTIAIIFIIVYALRLLSRYVFPFLLKRWVNKKMSEFQNQAQTQFREQQKAQQFAKEHEGEVKIKSRGNNNKPETDEIGDFVDFEEVD
ncbi:MAG: DUF4834 family protein [Flavobacteriales bacterium]|nr:DUF4834 family protein [Flavobacteriales bacterium]